MNPDKWIKSALVAGAAALGNPENTQAQQDIHGKKVQIENTEGAPTQHLSMLAEHAKELILCEAEEVNDSVTFNIQAAGASLIGDQDIFSSGFFLIKKGEEIVDHSKWQWLPYGPAEIMTFESTLPGKAKDYTVIFSFGGSSTPQEEIILDPKKSR